MLFDAELVSLFLYALQQLGVMLGVGSETIILLSYLLSMRDGVIVPLEARFTHAVGRVLNGGLILIIVSGVGIVILHILSGQLGTVLAPAFLFKWALIAVVVVCAWLVHRNVLPQGRVEMLAGGTWYAIFIVHILAPVTTWVNLLILYAVWMVGFALCWYALIRFTKQNSASQKYPSERSSVLLSAGKTGPQARPFSQNIPAQPRKEAPLTSPPMLAVALAKEGPVATSPTPKPPPPPPPQKPPPPLLQPVPPLPQPKPATPLPTIRVMPKHADDLGHR